MLAGPSGRPASSCIVPMLLRLCTITAGSPDSRARSSARVAQAMVAVGVLLVQVDLGQVAVRERELPAPAAGLRAAAAPPVRPGGVVAVPAAPQPARQRATRRALAEPVAGRTPVPDRLLQGVDRRLRSGRSDNTRRSASPAASARVPRWQVAAGAQGPRVLGGGLAVRADRGGMPGRGGCVPQDGRGVAGRLGVMGQAGLIHGAARRCGQRGQRTRGAAPAGGAASAIPRR